MIGLINFTHSDPLYSAFPEKDLVLRDTPKNLLASILKGEIGCGMISLFEYFENRDALELVESATIHSMKGTMSTLLVSRTGRLKKSMRIAITEHTRTTAVYLELILQKINIDYEFVWSSEREAEALLDEAEYALVIGDEALRVYGTTLRIIWDIGFQFSSIFSLMSVFSVTVKRKGTDCTKEAENLEIAIRDSPAHTESCVEVDSEKLGLPAEILRQYFRTIRYDFNR